MPHNQSAKQQVITTITIPRNQQDPSRNYFPWMDMKVNV